MRSSHGDVAVSNTDDRRFDSFRACEHRITSPGTQLLDNCKGIILGIVRHADPENTGRRALPGADPLARHA
jgi:hypothetical protein